MECCDNVSEIKHPAVRATLEYLKMNKGLEIHHDGDLPAGTGLGSSSAFTVGFLNAIHAINQKITTKKELSQEAIHVERKLLDEPGGIQDQIAIAHGGFNKIVISRSGEFTVEPITVSQQRLDYLKSHLMLYFTGLSRLSGEVAKTQIDNIPNKSKELQRMREMVDHATYMISGSKDLNAFGELLHEAWQIKRTFSNNITNISIDEIYGAARSAGAIGGKLIGAGGGGFMLLFARPEDHHRIRERLRNLLLVPFDFENTGAQIIFYDREEQVHP